ncbi:MAG: hypothetical protein IOD07_04150 [Bradyrhizobium sp.]|nr:hypothetical protein [Bradyrhizobium sp.]
MRHAFIAAAIALTAAAPVVAQTPAPAAPAAAKFGLDTPIEQLVANEKAKAVLDADMPGLSSHPQYDMFKAMSLKQLQPMSGGSISDEILKKVETDLATIS